jgi:hypothetical protein
LTVTAVETDDEEAEEEDGEEDGATMWRVKKGRLTRARGRTWWRTEIKRWKVKVWERAT